MLSPLELLAAGGAGLTGGLLAGFFGVGGNFILIPLLGFALGLGQREAQGLTLAALLPPLGLPAVWQYRRAGVPLLWKLVGAIIVGFVLAIPLGSWLATVLPARALRLGFGALLVVVAVRAWRQRAGEAERPFLTELPPRWLPLGLVAGASAGLASGLLGIGGAMVLIPILTRGLGLPQKQAQLTSLAMLLPPIALPGVIVYARAQGGLPWSAAVPVALGFVVGSFFGARLTRVVSAARLSRAFAVLLLGAAVALVVRAA
ncbi:MAG: sulfite exporter TauE/SafE family protein [Myxococcota bacterium]